MAGSIFYLGGIGTGQAGKLANNLLFGIGMVGAVECMRLAVAAGISEEMAAALIKASSGNNQTIQHWERWKNHVKAQSATKRINDVLHKDVALAMQMARELEVETPLCKAAHTRIDWALDQVGKLSEK